MTKTTFFTITTLSNLHVGSGDQNFGVVDNLVQRDPITEIPMINSSSLKGAIRDHFDPKGENSKKIKIIFGHSDKDEANAGEVKFMHANMLAMPVRSNTQMFFLATTPQILEDFIKSYKIFMKKDLNIQIPKIKDENRVYISTNESNSLVEDYQTDTSKHKELQELSKKLFNNQPVALFSDKLFKTLSLPIITRNKIAKTQDDDNNLFYEEVVPRNSIFYTYIITPTDIDIEDKKDLENIFENFINDMQTIIQVGANASIGYGLCEFKKEEL